MDLKNRNLIRLGWLAILGIGLPTLVFLDLQFNVKPYEQRWLHTLIAALFGLSTCFAATFFLAPIDLLTVKELALPSTKINLAVTVVYAVGYAIGIWPGVIAVPAALMITYIVFEMWQVRRELKAKPTTN